jgi:1,2-diacylglycerol 3-alpha-glucosyltransferase
MKKRVGIVTAWFERGGGYVSRQYREILEPHFDVHIFARRGRKYVANLEEWTDQRVWWADSYEFPGAMRFSKKEFQKWIKRNGIEIVFFNEQRWWQPLLWCKEWGLTIGSYIDYYTKDDRKLFEIYDFLICNTRRHYEAFSWHRNATYVPWGVDTGLFRPQCELGDTARSEKELVFFHSAGMSPDRKGTDLLIRAFAISKRAGRLLIHTQVDLSRRFPALKTVVASLVGAGRLEIIHRTTEPPHLYHMGDVYVYPSRLDGLGLSLPEAVSCGMAVIASNQEPMSEFVDESYGLLVDIDSTNERADGYYWPLCEPSIDSLARCMDYCTDNPGFVPTAKKHARAYAERHLDWSRNSVVVSDIFNGAENRAAPVALRDEIAAQEGVWEERLYRVVLASAGASRIFERMVALGRGLK